MFKKYRIPRKRKKEIRKYNKKLVLKYPFLLPRNVWTDKLADDYTYDYIRLKDEIPDGWWKRFGIPLCEDLKEVLVKYNYLHDYRFSQCKEKYGCYDEQTEVLTKQGWKYFRDVTYEDEFATLNTENGIMEYAKATDIISYKYNGKMYNLENRGISLLVTPNHNLYVSPFPNYKGTKGNFRKTNPEYTFKTPQEVFLKKKRFSKGCKWVGNTPLKVFKIDDYVRKDNYVNKNGKTVHREYHYVCNEIEIESFLMFLGFYIAEGCVGRINDKRFKEIQVAFNPKTEEKIVTELIINIGGKLQNTKQRGLKKFSNQALAQWLFQNCGHRAWNKKVPDFIKDLPPKYIEIFLSYLFLGDGHKIATAHILTTTSKQLAQDVEELLLKAGYSFSTSFRDRSMSKPSIEGRKVISKRLVYEVNWLKNTFIECDTYKLRKSKSYVEDFVNYNGMVYCVTVPYHTLFVKRNGKGVWCGNSLRLYDFGAPEEWFDHLYAWEYISEHTCVVCGKFPVPMRGFSWISPYCDIHAKSDKEWRQEQENDLTEKNWEGKVQEYITIKTYSSDGETEKKIDMKPFYDKIGYNYEKCGFAKEEE